MGYFLASGLSFLALFGVIYFAGRHERKSPTKPELPRYFADMANEHERRRINREINARHSN